MANLLWIQAAGCGGETASLLNGDRPHWQRALQLLGVTLLGHGYFTHEGERPLVAVLDDCAAGRLHVDLLVVEGAVYLANVEGPGWQTPRPAAAQLTRIAGQADYVVAVGTCAAFGGIMASGRNPLGATGLQFQRDQPGGLLGVAFRSGAGLPVVNVPGCPAHPDWMIGVLWALRAGRLNREELDRFNRPRAFYGKLAHHACPRNEYYEFKASATGYSEQGCLFENLGCKGTQCESDCNERLWLGRTGSCTRGGFPCLSCTSPTFPDGVRPFFRTAKIGGIPTSLPLDVPKAWYVGMSGLAKLACPERLRRNAVSFKPVRTDREEPDTDADERNRL